MGYLTGPYSLEDSKGEAPIQLGYYFSVWSKKNGEWKVAVDFGVQSPTARFNSDAPFELAPQPRHIGSTASAMPSAAQSLTRTESEFTDKAASAGLGAAVCTVGAPSFRYYRDGEPPRQGTGDFCGSLQMGERRQFKMRSSTVSKSGDLGFSYGDYALIEGQTGQDVEGSYVRVWK
jgi:hypothetical protein